MATETWRNWAKTQTARPARIERPADVEGVVSAVGAAVREDIPVRPVGSGHSLTGLAVTDGVMLDLSGLNRLRSVDPATGRVVVEAGIRLRRLWEELWCYGLAVDTLGGSGRQSLGGALATGEHGTGLRFGGIASQVRELELVTADAEVITCSERERPELFQAARVGLGAFGVVTAVTLACGPVRPVVRRHERVPVEAFLDEADDSLECHDHVEFTWIPHQREVVRSTVDRLAEPPSGLPPRRAVRPRFTERPYRALAPRAVHWESEYALPRACFGAAFEEVRALLKGEPARRAASLRVRFGAAEDAWLAMGQGRETCYIAAVTARNQTYQAFFAALESIAARYDGRPHWGRVHGLKAATLRTRYPRFDDARAVRDRVDAQRRFSNPYLELVLGR